MDVIFQSRGHGRDKNTNAIRALQKCMFFIPLLCGNDSRELHRISSKPIHPLDKTRGILSAATSCQVTVGKTRGHDRTEEMGEYEDEIQIQTHVAMISELSLKLYSPRAKFSPLNLAVCVKGAVFSPRKGLNEDH